MNVVTIGYDGANETYDLFDYESGVCFDFGSPEDMLQELLFDGYHRTDNSFTSWERIDFLA